MFSKKIRKGFNNAEFHFSAKTALKKLWTSRCAHAPLTIDETSYNQGQAGQQSAKKLGYDSYA